MAQFDETLLDSASTPLKDFIDGTEGLQTNFLTLVCELPTRVCSFPGTRTISLWLGLKAGPILSLLDYLSKQQPSYCLKTAVHDRSNSWELTDVEQEMLQLAPLYWCASPTDFLSISLEF